MTPQRMIDRKFDDLPYTCVWQPAMGVSQAGLLGTGLVGQGRLHADGQVAGGAWCRAGEKAHVSRGRQRLVQHSRGGTRVRLRLVQGGRGGDRQRLAGAMQAGRCVGQAAISAAQVGRGLIRRSAPAQ